MGREQPDDFATLKNAGQAIGSVVSWILVIVGAIDLAFKPAKGFPLPSSMPEQLFHLTVAAVAAAAVYGILWSGVEFACEWKYGAGATKVLPRDVHAVVLAVTLAVPLCVMPALYQRYSGVTIMTSENFIRNVAVSVMLCALVHLVLYGTRWSGMSGIITGIRASGIQTPLRKHAIISLLYYVLFAYGVGFSYRVLAGPPGARATSAWGLEVLAPALFAFAIETGFVLARYPKSLADYYKNEPDQSWVQVRGVLAGILLVFSLVFGMFLRLGA